MSSIPPPPLSRRRFVQAAAGAAALSSSWARPPRAAAAPTAPRRLFVVDMPNVVWRADWLPQGGRLVDKGTGDARQFQFGPQSAFLERIRKHVTFVEGVPIRRPGGDPHVAAQIHFMTGGVIPAGGRERSKYPSIDQILAKSSPLLSGGRAAPSVTWSAHSLGEPVRPHIHIISFDEALKPIYPQNSPFLAYRDLFAGFVPANGTAAQKAELELAFKQNRSVLDYVTRSVQRLSGRVSSGERQRLESHLQALRELEQKLQAPGAEVPSAAVKPPDPAALQPLKLNQTGNHREVIQSFFGLAKAAFGFDRTRVGTFMFSSGHNWVNLKELVPGLSRSGKIHEITHQSYANKNLDMRLVAHWYGNLLVDFVEDLARTPDVDGSSMLANTLVVLFSEVSIIGDGIDAQHHVGNTPLALIGGSALGNEGGRCLRYTGRSTNDFWLTIAQKFGVELTRVGEPGDNRGPLPELLVG